MAISIMMTNITIVEDQIAQLTRLVEGLVAHVQNQDVKIAKLTNGVEQDVGDNPLMSKNNGTQDEGETSKSKDVSKLYVTKDLPISSDGMIHVNHLKEFIEGTIKDKFDGEVESHVCQAIYNKSR